MVQIKKKNLFLFVRQTMTTNVCSPLPSQHDENDLYSLPTISSKRSYLSGVPQQNLDMNMSNGSNGSNATTMNSTTMNSTSTNSTPTTNNSNSSSFIFRCKTNDAYMIKILMEILHNNIKTGCFEISSDKIHFCMTDASRRTLLHFELYAKDFNIFQLNSDTPLKVGLNINHFYRMLKSIKKKDSMVLFIREDRPHELGIQIMPKEHTRLTISYIRVQNIQNLEILLPGPYVHSVLISSSEFSKMCKDMLSISNTLHVVSNVFHVRFVSHLGSVYSREVILGETELENDSDHTSLLPTIFEDDFETEQLSRIVKMSGLSPTINIYSAKGLPILIRSRIGNLGFLSIYMKSRGQVEEEAIHSQNNL